MKFYVIMKNFFLLFISIILLASCENRDKKIQNAVSQELKGILYDFESYEPIKTKVDSAFFSPYIDPEVKALMYSMAKPMQELETAKREYNNALSSVALWDMPYSSSYSRQQRKEAIAKRDAAKLTIENNQAQLISVIKALYTRIKEDETSDDKFIGWFVIQRYRCKTGGGYPSFGDDVFVFNKDITECIFYMSCEEYENLKNFVNQLLSIPEDEFLKKIEDINLLDNL